MSTLTMVGVVPTWTLADRLRKARETRGVNQTELGELTGISRRAISRYESGESTPRRPHVMAWAMATGISLEWLEEGECAVRDSNPEPADVCFGFDDSEDWLCRRCGCEVDQGATLCDGCFDELQAVAA